MTDFRSPDPCGENPILVVEEDAAVRSMLGRVLAGEGYSVWPVADWRDGLELADAHRFRAVLLERGPVGKQGRDPLREFRSRHPLMPAIVLAMDPDQAAAAMARGAAACFEKPLDFPTLLKAVASLLAEPPEPRPNPRLE